MEKTDRETAARGTWKRGQWPDNICSGFISQEPSSTGSGFVFRDASHGIPVLGHVTSITYHGSYPRQAEEIARRFVACWNACQGRSIEDLEAEAARKINASEA